MSNADTFSDSRKFPSGGTSLSAIVGSFVRAATIGKESRPRRRGPARASNLAGLRKVEEERKAKTIRRGKLERQWESEGLFAGTDEVGVAAIAGKLLACAVILPPKASIEGVRDSKTVPTHEERSEIAEEIRYWALDFSFGWVEPEEVSALGTFSASVLAMERAVMGLRVIPNRVITDFHKLLLPTQVKQVNLVKADSKIFTVAAASILAKVTRDEYMRELHQEFPEYGWFSGVGYRTPQHWRGLRKYGPTIYHRLKYIPPELKEGRVLRGSPVLV